MLKSIVFICFVGVAVGTPPVVRTREEIESFRHYLESTKSGAGSRFLARSQGGPIPNPEENSGRYDGDIVLDDFIIEDMIKEYAMGRNAYLFPNTKWPNNTIVWDYGHDFEPHQIASIEEGIRDIEAHTCIRFRRRTPQDTAYVSVTGLTDGCYAHVGYWATRGVHTYNLATDAAGWYCFRHATVVHEWMHILGFFHMQSTHDRDNYVQIVTENMIPGTENSFRLYSSSEVSNHDIEYDYVSCLHYGPFAFSGNGQRTIVALREHEGTMGQREYITDKDWLRINRHYNCPGAWN